MGGRGEEWAKWMKASMIAPEGGGANLD